MRRLARKVVEERSLDVLDEVAAGEFAAISRRSVSPFQSAFPDFEMEIVDLIADDDSVAAGVALGRQSAHTPRDGGETKAIVGPPA